MVKSKQVREAARKARDEARSGKGKGKKKNLSVINLPQLNLKIQKSTNYS